MYIKSLKLQNVRNYDCLDITFNSGINILYGDNAQGKTNILESIFLSATTKSHKGSKDKEVIRFGQDEGHIRTLVVKDEITHKIDMHLKKNKSKGVAIDGLTIRRSSELFGLCNIIFFSPEDLGIIKNGPSGRRKFMDTELCQIDKIYLQYLAKYNKVLYQRNSLLKQIHYDKSKLDMLSVWDAQLITYGTYIINRRNTFIQDLNTIISEKHRSLTGNLEDIELVYECNVTSDFFEEQLKSKCDMDLHNCNTSVGPHRDDIRFVVNDVDIRRFGSQGQQRTAALSLKLSEIEMVRRIIKDSPILLLDDVLSELDSNRQNYLLNNIADVQVIITCTGLDEFVHNRLQMDMVYEVVNGTIKKIEK
jgi:DNA replication and repair protein RecF